MFVIFSACSMGLGIVTSVISFINGNKDYKKETETREKEYRDYIQRKRKEIEEARQLETQQLAKIHWPAQMALQQLFNFSGELFDRRIDDEDFLRICIGSGQQEAKRPIKITEKESITVSDELAKIPVQIRDEYRYIPNAPIYVDAKNDNAIGVVGSSECLYELMKLMTLDVCVRQYYNDVRLVYVFGAKEADLAAWVRWLPNVTNSALGIRNIVCDDESRSTIFENLYVELTVREQQKSLYPQVVVFVMDDYGLKSHPLSKYIDRAKDFGFTFVFFEAKQELLPQGCDEVIILERGSAKGVLMQVKNINDKAAFTYQPIHEKLMQRAAITLAPVYSEEVSLENSLTKSITMFELLGIVSPEDIDLENNWKRSVIYRSLAAPLGVKSKNETVYLDLHEKAHGSHALVAGTTGSGKSELLQSYILSMAILYPPYEISFLLIDFKGGGMANQFRDLPHLQGAITNIDGRELERSLKSIKAELLKRQCMLAEANASNISDYTKMYRSGEVTTPMPHLIIIVDEFAELKAQQPEFMAELISAFRIGRSLGVHLILATQKPAGQVNEQMWANTRTKLCLKVNEPQDSNEMLKSPLAAEVREPGRAYMLVGNNESFELFQSAFSGAPATVDSNGAREFSISDVSLTGRRSAVFVQKSSKDSGTAMTQLDAIVDYIRNYCEHSNIPKLPAICLPPLPEVIPFSPHKNGDSTQTVVTIGVYDNPNRQYQGEVQLNLSTDNVFVIGSSQTGKTNLLQTIVRAVAENYSPEEATMYIVDCSSMILKNFEQLAHVGGVVTKSEDEAMKNLFKMLLNEIATRKEKLMAVGVSSFTAYREAGLRDMPQIVLLIDNLTALKELYLQDNDVLQNICQEGATVGLSVIAANTQTSGIGYRYLSNFSTRIAFFCNDSSEYSTVFEHCRMQPQNLPGRCLIEMDKAHYECQIYQAFEGKKEIERVQAMRALKDRVNAKYVGMRSATAIPVIPNILTKDIAMQHVEKTLPPYRIIAGLNYGTVEPVIFDVTKIGLLAISGRPGMGRSNFVRHMLLSLEGNRQQAPVSVCIVDGLNQKLADLQELTIVSNYTLSAEAALETISQWDEELQSRYEMLTAGDVESIKKASLLLLIIQNNDVASAISENQEVLTQYKNFFLKYKALKVGVIFSDFENANIPYGAPEAIKLLRDKHNFLFFDDIASLKIFDVPITTARQFKKKIDVGDCYYMTDDGITKLKTVLRKER